MQMSNPSEAASESERVLVTDRIFAQLRAAILAHELSPGMRLSVPRLALRYGVSRSPVREAVQRLVQVGLADQTPHRGCAVATVTPAKLIPLYEVREVLEGLAARLAALHATRDDLARLHAELQAHESAVKRRDVRAHVEHDLAFHSTLRHAAGNAELVAALDRVEGQVTIAMLSADHTNWPVKAVTEHHAILDAIVGAHPDAAEAAARAHVVRIRLDIARHEEATQSDR